MKTHRCYLTLCICLGLCLLASPAWCASVKRILIIHSYHEDFIWSEVVNQGIFEALEEERFIVGDNLEVKAFYMDTKNHPEVSWKQEKAREALALVKSYGPDVIIACDDNAQEYVTRQLKDTPWPVVFAGVSADPTTYGVVDSLDEPGHNVTGSLERERFIGSLRLLKRIVPGISSIAVVSDDGPTALPILQRIRAQVPETGMTLSGIKAAANFDEWKAFVTDMQDKADLLVVASYHVVKNIKGGKIPANEVLKWTIENNHLPDVGFFRFAVEGGLLFSEAISGFQQGYQAGSLAAFIADGQPPADFPITSPRRGEICINLARAKQLGIRVPSDILGTATRFDTMGALK
ncbi:MAG: hypothetical protein HUN04_12135 [Desulfobacter sp.]|nr:MAG: hypothetical protein HUN04_12135 [Desulfobacter sp.]